MKTTDEQIRATVAALNVAESEKDARTPWGASTRRITYYGFADGKIGQLFVVRENGRQVSQEWTGVTYRTTKEAYRDMARLNFGAR